MCVLGIRGPRSLQVERVRLYTYSVTFVSPPLPICEISFQSHLVILQPFPHSNARGGLKVVLVVATTAVVVVVAVVVVIVVAVIVVVVVATTDLNSPWLSHCRPWPR